MMAKRHDLARGLLLSAIAAAPIGSYFWSKATWALARMEALLKNHAAAAASYLAVAQAAAVPQRFRLQARMLWAQSMLAAGDREALRACAASLPTLLSGITDFETLLDFARQLSRSEGELIDAAQKIFNMGHRAALDAFAAAQHPSAALDILYKLTRRQVYDFGESRNVTSFWESLSESKKLWLWNNDNRWWGYIALVLMAYCRSDRLAEATALAQATLEDPATPREALPTILIPYYEELIKKGRAAEALEAFRWIVTENPTKSDCATAYYWLALEAYRQGDRAAVAQLCQNLLLSNAHTKITCEKWLFEAKALLLKADLNPEGVPEQAVNFDTRYLQKARRSVLSDLGRL